MDEKLLRDMQPFWNSWYIDGVIGEGSYGSVYRIVREEFGQKYYSALKIISTPKNRSELKQALMEGMSESDAQEYFKSKAEEIYKEIIMMAKLKGKSSIVSYEDHQVVERKNGEIGYDILIRMELLKGLNDYVMSKTLDIPEIVRMGKEICQGLVICQNNGIMHRDIKPDNIFVTRDKEFKLGDFGIARKMESLEHGFTIRGTYEYMAPEVYHGEEYDGRVDIYSLGIVLYMFLNKKKTPFLPTDTTRINHNMRQEALKQRFSGDQMDTPLLAGEELSYVVMKAIAYEPDARFQSAKDFLSALEAIKEEDMSVFKGDWQEKNEKVLKRLREESEERVVGQKDTEVSVEEKDLENTVSLKEEKEEFEEGTVSVEKPAGEISEDKAENEESSADADNEKIGNDVEEPEGEKEPENAEKPEGAEKAESAGKPESTGKPENSEKAESAVKLENVDDLEAVDLTGGNLDSAEKKSIAFNDTGKYDKKNSLDDIDDGKKGASSTPYKDSIRPMTSTMYQPEKKKGNAALVITIISLVAVVAVIVMLFMPHDSDTEDGGTGPDVVATVVTSPEPIDIASEEPTKEPDEEPDKEPLENSEPTSEPEVKPTKKPAATQKPTKKPVPEPITDFPDANSSELEEITQLENYQYAVSINVINNRIKDISPLSECLYLEKLQASYNRISDITVLERLTTLKEIDLIHNAVDDISPLAGLTELKSLKLAYNNVSDLTALAGLDELEELDLSGNADIHDLEPVLGLKKLKNVYILDIDGLKKEQVNELRELVEGNGGMLFE